MIINYHFWLASALGSDRKIIDFWQARNLKKYCTERKISKKASKNSLENLVEEV